MPSFDEIAERHDLALLLQFGSTVAGTPHGKSDVDLGVLYDRPPPSYFDLGDLISDLQEHFSGREVDLAVLDRADPFFLHQVLARCRRLAGSERRLAVLKIDAFLRYQDHRPFLALERAWVERRLRELGQRELGQ